MKVSPPDSIKRMIQNFSAQLRFKQTTQLETSQPITLYRKILRENIKSVALAVYPLFFSKYKEEANGLIDTFFEKHNASNPEFHKIATELMLFFRERNNITQRDKQLIEYEWLLYTIEIDTHQVEKTVDFPAFDTSNSVCITINPTLQLVELPFNFDKENFLTDDNQEKQYYVIYRKHNNAIFQKKIPLEDVQFIATVKNHDKGIILEKGNHLVEQNGFQSWLEQNFYNEILFLKIIQ